MSGAGLLLDGRPLQGLSAVRGIGTYTRGLLGGLRAVAPSLPVSLLLRRGAPAPPEARAGSPLRVRALGRWQPVADPLLVAAALRGRPEALYHAVEWGLPARSRLPVVLTVHDLIPQLFPEQFPRLRLAQWLPLHLARRADAVVVPSRQTAADLCRLAGVDPARVTVVHHGLDERLQPAAADAVAACRARLGIAGPLLLAVGVMDPHKRFDLLLDVLDGVRVRSPATLVLAGDQGRYAASVAARVAERGLESHVRLAGHVPAADLAALYTAADCLVHTSAYEGFGLPLLEAMRCGTPVAAFANSCLPEVTAGAARLVPDGDAGALAGAVLEVLGDAAERGRLVAAGTVRAAELTWERAAATTLAVYRRVAPQLTPG